MNWVDVNDKLPPKMKKVLFYCQEGNLKNIYMGYLTNGGWDIYLPYHSFELHEDVVKVTHWMELPDNPK